MAKILIFFSLATLCFGHPALSDEKPILRVPLFARQISLDPTGVQDQSSLWVSRQLNCQLVRQKGRTIALEAASDFKYLSPKLIEITIDQKAKFTDGSPVTSKDVVATLNYLKDSRKVLRNIFEWTKSYRAKGSDKVEI